MSSPIDVFNDNHIRYKIINNILWICANDLAALLNKTKSTIRTNLNGIRADWKMPINQATSGGMQNMIFIKKPAALMIILGTRCTLDSPIKLIKEWAAVKLH